MIGRVYHRWVYTKQVPDELLYSSEIFRAEIPEKKQIIVHGDGTPGVYLYFLNRKGVSVDLHSISSAKCQIVIGVKSASENKVISFPLLTELTNHSTNPWYDGLRFFPTMVVRMAM